MLNTFVPGILLQFGSQKNNCLTFKLWIIVFALIYMLVNIRTETFNLQCYHILNVDYNVDYTMLSYLILLKM